jgi:hypothetical protein
MIYSRTPCQDLRSRGTTDTLYNSLTDYVFESHLAKLHHDRRNNKSGKQLQKGGIVYASDVNRDVTLGENLLKKWASLNLTND